VRFFSICLLVLSVNNGVKVTAHHRLVSWVRSVGLGHSLFFRSVTYIATHLVVVLLAVVGATSSIKPNSGDTRPRNLYKNLSPNRTQLYSVQVSDTSFLIVCHRYKAPSFQTISGQHWRNCSPTKYASTDGIGFSIWCYISNWRPRQHFTHAESWEWTTETDRKVLPPDELS